MLTPYPPDSRELDASSGAEQVNFHPDNEAEQSLTVDGRPTASPKLAIEHETALHGSTLKKEAARLVSPETRHDNSESDNMPASRKKPTLSSKSAANLAKFEKLLEGYKAEMLESKADKIRISGREFLSLEKAAEFMYQHIERMEALSVQRSEAEARRAEAESNNLLHQIQLEHLRRQPGKSNEIKN
ncbi:hypothetical protein RvY_02799 [Ramazzottius varieornatus]|uniref:Uncharacterized protein n=1 Tax=Ramazzottius varieornatus TaxID=947166 RepID=A0A1D1UKY3_RAMVA|nr:hypothetical protein RvY_02799 [Ramazzottius varieornatus]